MYHEHEAMRMNRYTYKGSLIALVLWCSTRTCTSVEDYTQLCAMLAIVAEYIPLSFTCLFSNKPRFFASSMTL